MDNGEVREAQVSADTTNEDQQSELERTLGLPQALAIGTGTMVGAGIFVFPGLAAGEAGPAATVSFGIGAVIALLVALPASELATAMPESGGGYYFVSRSLGALFGTMVGIGQWLGLVFASAFYLMGFGYYLADIIQALGVGLSLPVTGTACAIAIALTAISITGTENAGNLQNGIVAVLLLLLVGFLGWGGLDAFGFFGRMRIPEEFAPYGYPPILTTAALVFTSYLGFAQIATVAGEIKNPARNLPLSMVGSVGLVGVLYVATIFISTSFLESARLAELGETAIVAVGREVLGGIGAVAILTGGLLATLSSANASILSSSRSIYALSRDNLVPEEVGWISRRYRTPHVALVMAGGPIAGLVLFGRVEVLAEVASMLHLFMYGLICIALIILRRADLDWYTPGFSCPAYPILPAAGAAASFGIIAFMQPLSIILGGLILAAAGGWHMFYAPEVELSEVKS